MIIALFSCWERSKITGREFFGGGNEFLSVYKAFIEVIGKAVVLLVIFDFNL